jgi:hypothetical protein
MTIVVAFYCTDGVVVASDSMLTSSIGQITTGHHSGRKIHVLSHNQVFAFAGDQGQADRFRVIADAQDPSLLAQVHALNYPLAVTQAVIQQFQATGIADTVGVNTVLAFSCGHGHQCCAFMGKLQPWLLDVDHFYVALGSGKQMADPFLRFLADVFCPKQPTVREAVFLAAWTIDHVIRTNPGGVAGPIRMALLEMNNGSVSARELNATEIGEQQQAIASAARVLRDWRDLISGRAEPDAPSAPPQRPKNLN